jgi:tRNA threonylcarbamoyl adenosine modification protein (Sua5/YciO/YrdC/YwlC family)
MPAALAALARGDLVVVPTDTVYGLAADPSVPGAVDRLLAAKGRTRSMPPPVLVASQVQAKALTRSISGPERALMRSFWPGALTLVLPKRADLGWDPAPPTVALRQPDHPIALSLLRQSGPLAVSSANLTGRPPALTVHDAVAQLGNKVAVYVDGGPVPGGEASTVVAVTGGEAKVLRLGAVPAVAIALALSSRRPGR